MWKKLLYGAVAAVVVGLLTLPAPAQAGSARHPRYHGSAPSGYCGPHCYRPYGRYYAPRVRYYAPPVQYYAPPVQPYYYAPYRPSVDVRVVFPFPFFSFYLW